MMNINKLLLYVLSTILLASSCAEDITSLTGGIKGLVKDETSGHFLENCQINLSPKNESLTTSNDGSFFFQNLTPGSYTLSFSKVGYVDQSKSVNVITGEVINVDVLLKAKESFFCSSNFLDFGDLETNKSFTLMNNSDETYSFSINNIPEWATVNINEGMLKSESSVLITLNVDRSKLKYGNHEHTIIVSYKGRTEGDCSIALNIKKVQHSLPVVEISTDPVEIKQHSIKVKGKILATGGSEILAYGHCWSISKNPTINDFKTELGQTNKTESFISDIVGLSPSETYYVRSYAKNAIGISYSEEVTFTTQDEDSHKWNGDKAVSFSEGRGTFTDPYVIKTGGELLLIGDYPSCHYVLANNIDLNNHNWLPISFDGVLNGNGYSIFNLRIERKGPNLGLFSVLSGSISNLNFKGVKIISEDSNVGTLAGSAYSNAKVSNVNVVLDQNSLIRGESYVGGLIGQIFKRQYIDNDISIKKCTIISNNGDFTIIGTKNVGGLVGTVSDVFQINDCHVAAKIKADNIIGGLIGCIGELYIPRNLYNLSFKGEILGNNYVGGILGLFSHYYGQEHITLTSSMVDATITGQENVGGIIGISQHNRTYVEACYYRGDFHSPSGGLIADSKSLDNLVYIESCYTAPNEGSVFAVPFGGTTSSNSATIVKGECLDIVTFLKECHSDCDKYWDYENPWIWTGCINKEKVNVRCPRLIWEK